MRTTGFLAKALLALAVIFTSSVPARADEGTVLITGANRGIGLELVRQYADRGWKVIATARNVAEANELNELASLLPNRRLRLAGEPDVETLWDTPLALILLMVLLTLEWVVRRLIKLA